MQKRIKMIEVDSVIGKTKLIELNQHHTKVVISTYGAGIFDFIYKGRQLLQRPQSLDDYLQSRSYYGKTIGRTSGRLFPPHFKIDDHLFEIKKSSHNDVHIHGGDDGFSFKTFELIRYTYIDQQINITLRYVSKDLEGGYPGELTLDVSYSLNKYGALTITYDATTTKDTLCNITNHIYFNLNEDKQNLDDTLIKVLANKYIETDQSFKPISEKQVYQTPFDMLDFKPINDVLKTLNQNGIKGLNTAFSDVIKDRGPIVQLKQIKDRLGVDIYSTYPSVVIYTHDYPDHDVLISDKHHGVHGSIAIECQYEPAGIYLDELHDSILRKHQRYHEEIKFVPYTIKKDR